MFQRRRPQNAFSFHPEERLTVHPADLDRALERCADFFADRESRPGVVARRLLGIPNAYDETLIEQLVNEGRRRTRLDGGIDGWVVATAWSAWELLQLGCPPDHTGVVRMVGYLLSRQDKPGRFGEGCDPKRHAAGLCSHFLSGFFSPGSIDEQVSPLSVPSGARIEGEWSSRFAASCFTLRTVLHARQERRPAVTAHIDSLLYLGERWLAGEYQVNPALPMFGLSALALAPIAYQKRIEPLALKIIAAQGPDGQWPGVPLFHAMDTMLGLATPEARIAIRLAVPLLLTEQREDGSFDDTADEELALVGLRALRSTGSGRTTPKPPRYSNPVKRPDARRRDRANR